LAALAGLPPRESAQANAVTITFARTISESPVAQAIRFAPFLRVLENQMEARLRYPVFMDLLLCRDRSWADPAVSRGDADLQSLSPLTYVRLKQSGSKLTPIGWWGREQEEGVLFARLGAGVTNLSQVRSHRAVFAHSNSIVSFLAKAYLARAGICSTDLTACRVLQRTEQREAPESRLATGQGEAESENEDYAHREVIQRVLAGEYDVGVATSRRFELNRHRGQKLVKLVAFPITANVLVVGAHLDAKVASALQQCICHLPEKDRPRVLSKFNRSAGEGIITATDTDFDEMRGILANELVFFESGVRTGSAPDKSPK
jgi:ABC-type phosphate/phosphonate transport system substrate-binding protein